MSLHLNAQLIVNDSLMIMFFLAVDLEVKCELMHSVFIIAYRRTRAILLHHISYYSSCQQ